MIGAPEAPFLYIASFAVRNRPDLWPGGHAAQSHRKKYSRMAPPNKHDRKKKPDRPAFNEAALTQLTSKIDKTLSKSHKDEKPEKRKRPDVPERGPQPKKRRRAEGKPERKSGRTDGKKNADPAIAGKITSSELLVEIKALGGDEKDLELVANIDSGIEDELEESAGLARDVKLDGVFRKELAQFASSLGFQEIEREDVSSDEPDHSDRSRDDDSEDDSDVPEPEPVPERPQKQKSAGKLVSKRSIQHSLDRIPGS